MRRFATVLLLLASTLVIPSIAAAQGAIAGLVTDTSLGINLQTNGAGLVRFDGGLSASTGANTAFNATGGGNVAVTDPNAVGTAPEYEP